MLYKFQIDINIIPLYNIYGLFTYWVYWVFLPAFLSLLYMIILEVIYNYVPLWLLVLFVILLLHIIIVIHSILTIIIVIHVPESCIFLSLYKELLYMGLLVRRDENDMSRKGDKHLQRETPFLVCLCFTFYIS